MPSYKELFEALTRVGDVREMDQLMHELLTPKELDDIWRRWQVMEDLYHGVPQREIAERHRMSLCKITRGSKVLQNKNSIFRKIIEKREKK
ncbi:MAG: Trp family transcriptional regulator [Candidatus Omnitrophota bacterium]